MSGNNSKTIGSYNDHIKEYIKGTPHSVAGAHKKWIDKTLEKLPHSAKILELGSAFGRDADYIEEQGYAVERTDGTQGFVDLLNKNKNQAKLLNIVTDEIKGSYDLIFASAVLLHLTRKEIVAAVGKVYLALSQNGRFSFSLKRGKGEGWSEEKLNAPRYFCYWEKNAIAKILDDTGFKKSMFLTDKDCKWLFIIADK